MWSPFPSICFRGGGLGNSDFPLTGPPPSKLLDEPQRNTGRCVLFLLFVFYLLQILVLVSAVVIVDDLFGCSHHILHIYTSMICTREESFGLLARLLLAGFFFFYFFREEFNKTA